ncbi:carboxymuconolactone decarboxylase family protein [Chitinasiproducens palmae]|uniref:4-carboxymuconolactone decarboxylase n=1 Tax=Chitinasiproducens palmae TaxID=1770053 RepID=A0A1H2PM82_9BURK|nr:carboxymuconolactone decarboxylase family protein [Chitinasiproducens palmae]SDV47213.1 4-carboxymuconolactone decarboxylase [Chitinasiproducens palmae]
MRDDALEKGFAMRRRVVGAKHVEASLTSGDDFAQPMQELATRYCWGDVWNREGLELKTRSLLIVAMLASLNRPTELRLHIRGALRNGAGRAEIRETLLQVAVYAGMPAGLEAFRQAKTAFGEHESDGETVTP